jgi:tetratricopeptide (TPR) repeat protein
MTFLRAISVALLLCFPLIARAYEPCGELHGLNQYGPYDYRTATEAQKTLVETYHFTAQVETLQSGQSGALGQDIDYTLRALPNHPRALLAMMKLSAKLKTEQPFGAKWKVECYFERALRFTPDDSTVHMLYGIYLLKRGDKEKAVHELETARNASEDPNVRYNLGLAYFELGQYDRALEEAKKAYAMGFPLPGLRDKLKRAGKWQD